MKEYHVTITRSFPDGSEEERDHVISAENKWKAKHAVKNLSRMYEGEWNIDSIIEL